MRGRGPQTSCASCASFHSMLCNNASGPEIGLRGRISGRILIGKTSKLGLRLAGRPMLMLSRQGSCRNPTRKHDFRPGSIITSQSDVLGSPGGSPRPRVHHVQASTLCHAIMLSGLKSGPSRFSRRILIGKASKWGLRPAEGWPEGRF
jgi:hypothetical protein